MNPSYLRLYGPVDDAMKRYGSWVGTPEIEPPRLVSEREAFDLSLADGSWRGLAVYIYSAASWTVFEEISGGLTARSAEDWVRLADGGDLVFEGYNDAIGYGELVYIKDGNLVRRFVQYDEDPGADSDIGRLPEELTEPIKDWTDVAAWVERDEDELLQGAEQGWLWIHRATW
jgi:hypothetical protein